MPSHARLLSRPASRCCFFYLLGRRGLLVIGTAIIAYIQNPRTFVATRFLLAVVAIDTSRTLRANEKACWLVSKRPKDGRLMIVQVCFPVDIPLPGIHSHER